MDGRADSVVHNCLKETYTLFISPKVFSVVLCLSLFPLLKQPSIAKAQTQVIPDNPSGASASVVDESVLAKIVEAEVAEQMESSSPVIASRSSNGFRLETRDGNWQTNFQLRAQMRFTTPYRSDPGKYPASSLKTNRISKHVDYA